MIIFVWSVMADSNELGVTNPFSSACTLVTSHPILFNGLTTALCSILVVMTWSDSVNKPFNA